MLAHKKHSNNTVKDSVPEMTERLNHSSRSPLSQEENGAWTVICLIWRTSKGISLMQAMQNASCLLHFAVLAHNIFLLAKILSVFVTVSWDYLDPVKCNALATAGIWNQPGSCWIEYAQITSLILRKINQIKTRLFSNKFENGVFYRRVQ